MVVSISSFPKLFPLALALAAAGVAALSLGTTVAAAAAPCWRTLFRDYADNGRVDNTYRLHCYREALNRLDSDIQIYGSAANDIRRSLQQEIRLLEHRGTEVGPNTRIPGGFVAAVANARPSTSLGRLFRLVLSGLLLTLLFAWVIAQVRRHPLRPS